MLFRSPRYLCLDGPNQWLPDDALPGFRATVSEFLARTDALAWELMDVMSAGLGLPDGTWGEAVTAVVVLKAGTTLELPALREWCKGRLSVYKIPHRLRVVAELPRNAMGKVTKPTVRALF